MVNALTVGVFEHVLQFRITEPIVRMNENIKYGTQGFHTAEKAAASAAQPRYVVTQISIGTFYVVRVAFVLHIPFMTANKVYAQITAASVCIIFLCLHRTLNHPLYHGCINRVVHSICHDLAGCPAYHRHDVRVYAFFVSFALANVPIYLV